MSALTIFTNHLLLDLWQDGTPYSRILTALSFGALTLWTAFAAHSFARAGEGGLLPGWLSAGVSACLPLRRCRPTPRSSNTSSPPRLCCGAVAGVSFCWRSFTCCSTVAVPQLPVGLSLCRSLGGNALLAYLLTEIHAPGGHSIWWGVAHPLFYGIAARSGAFAAPVFSLLSLLLLWCLLFFLHRHRAFLRV